jgi:hypothetical protein
VGMFVVCQTWSESGASRFCEVCVWKGHSFYENQVSFHRFPCAEVVVLVHINVLAILTTFVGHLNLLNLLTIFTDVLNLICFTQGDFNPRCNLHWE